MKVTLIDKRSKEKASEIDEVVGIRFEDNSIVIATSSGASKY